MLKRALTQLLLGDKHILLPRKEMSCHFSCKDESKESMVGRECEKSKERISERLEKQCEHRLDNLNENMKIRKKRIEAEIEEYRMRDYKMPNRLSAKHWWNLLTGIQSAGKRLKYLEYLQEQETVTPTEIKISKKNVNDDGEHLLKKSLLFENPKHITSVSKYAAYKTLLFGNPLVFDMDFSLSDYEQRLTHKRIMNCYGLNMRYRYPFHVHFTGYQNSFFETMADTNNYEKHLIASLYKKSFVDLFDKDRLVYLSPQGPVLSEYDGNNIYVVGAYVDFYEKYDRTFTKAKELGIRTGRFPLHSVGMYRHKELDLNVVMDIMLEVNLSHDWEQAIYHSLHCTYRPSKDRSMTERRKKEERKEALEWIKVLQEKKVT